MTLDGDFYVRLHEATIGRLKERERCTFSLKVFNSLIVTHLHKYVLNRPLGT